MPDKRRDLRERLTNFAIAIIDLVRDVPRGFAHDDLLTQLTRSGTNAGAKFARVSGSTNRRYFALELARVEVFLAETQCWLDTAQRQRLFSERAVQPVRKECGELLSLITRSLLAAKISRDD